MSYGTGYNQTWGGDFGDVRSGMTEEQRKEYSKNLSEAMKGKPKSEEHKRKIGEALKGKLRSEEHRQHLSEAKKGLFAGGNNPMARSVICIETKQVFDTIKEAQEWLGKGNIKSHLRGSKKSAGKHPITGEKLHWMYYEDWLKLNENSDTKAEEIA